MRRLPEDEWYDIVIFRFLRAVRLWFTRPDLHRWAFRTVAYQNMRSAIGHELEKQGRRIQAVSLEAFIQSNHKNMCFEYDTSAEAKKKLSTINATRRSKNEADIYDTYRVDQCVYVVRKEKKKGKE